MIKICVSEWRFKLLIIFELYLSVNIFSVSLLLFLRNLNKIVQRQFLETCKESFGAFKMSIYLGSFVAKKKSFFSWFFFSFLLRRYRGFDGLKPIFPNDMKCYLYLCFTILSSLAKLFWSFITLKMLTNYQSLG